MSLLYIKNIETPKTYDNYWGSSAIVDENGYNQNCLFRWGAIFYPFLENSYNNFYLRIETNKEKSTKRVNIFQNCLLPFNVYGKF